MLSRVLSEGFRFVFQLCLLKSNHVWRSDLTSLICAAKLEGSI